MGDFPEGARITYGVLLDARERAKYTRRIAQLERDLAAARGQPQGASTQSCADAVATVSNRLNAEHAAAMAQLNAAHAAALQNRSAEAMASAQRQCAEAIQEAQASLKNQEAALAARQTQFNELQDKLRECSIARSNLDRELSACVDLQKKTAAIAPAAVTTGGRGADIVFTSDRASTRPLRCSHRTAGDAISEFTRGYPGVRTVDPTRRAVAYAVPASRESVIVRFPGTSIHEFAHHLRALDHVTP